MRIAVEVSVSGRADFGVRVGTPFSALRAAGEGRLASMLFMTVEGDDRWRASFGASSLSLLVVLFNGFLYPSIVQTCYSTPLLLQAEDLSVAVFDPPSFSGGGPVLKMSPFRALKWSCHDAA